MSRNIKLVERLKNKIKVSSFFNNIEHRNKKLFQDFIYSSDKRAKDLRTGLKINKAIDQGSKNMARLCKQMSEDIILKNSKLLLKEKKLISENTEQETHLKINELLKNLKTAIKTPYGVKMKPTKKIIKSLSHDEIKDAQVFIGEEIKKEQKQIQNKINKYLKKLHETLDNSDNKENDKNEENNYINNDNEDDTFRKNNIKRKREFNRYVDNIYMKENIKFINYRKPKPFQIKDKESANLKRIKDCLYPPSLEELANKTNEKKDNDDDIDESDNTSIKSKTILKFNKRDKKNFMHRNVSMSNIKSNISINKLMSQEPNNSREPFEELENIDVTGKDTLEVLNNLVDQGKYLSERMEKKFERINSLIDFNLPYPTSYELVVKYIKNLENINNSNKKNSFYLLQNKSNQINDLKNANKTLPEIAPNLRKKILFLKDDIKNLKNTNYNKIIKLDNIFKSYLGLQTSNHNKFIKLKKNIGKNKKISHKH